MKVVLVAGARPNFMKVAPILHAMHGFNDKHGGLFEPLLVHTGQHYDYQMSRVFFEDLDLPEPDIYLGVGSGSHAEQTGRTMVEFEKALLKEKPELVLVVGDVNSTVAAALTATKLHLPVAHVEAGLRSYDKTMPEEINRVLTDQIADMLFTPSPDADENLLREGIPQDKIHFVGNVMVDALLDNLDKAKGRCIPLKLGLETEGYAALTLHRPANVDDEYRFREILKSLQEISSRIPVVFPVHPRTKNNIQEFGLGDFLKQNGGIHLIEPLGYLDFLNLLMSARFVMTDSGGVQEEATVLNVPCLTLRNTTEWKITVTQGTNTVIENVNQQLADEASRILDNKGKEGSLPELWDGKAAERIVEVISQVR